MLLRKDMHEESRFDVAESATLLELWKALLPVDARRPKVSTSCYGPSLERRRARESGHLRGTAATGYWPPPTDTCLRR